MLARYGFRGHNRSKMRTARRIIRTAGIGLVWLGALAPFMVRTIWSVPMALVLSDPREMSVPLVVAGAFLVVLSKVGAESEWSAVATWALIGGVALSIAGTTWVFVTSPYHLVEARFQNGEADLRGTLVLPIEPGPHPAIVFMHGSGPEKRGLWFHFADQFAREGVAALIYDKRGSGNSEGGNPRDPYAALAADAVAGVDWLTTLPEIDPHRIGLWGISEGGWTAPLAASMSLGDVNFLVVVSGTGAAPEDEDVYSIRTHLEDQNFPSDDIELAISMRMLINDYYRTGDGREGLLESVLGVETTAWYEAAGTYLPPASDIYVYGSDEWRRHMEFLDFDAVPLISELEIPMLFVHGGRDRSYPTDQSVERLEQVAALPGKEITVVVYPQADHAILARYLPWPRYADGYIDQMVTWVVEHTGGIR